MDNIKRFIFSLGFCAVIQLLNAQDRLITDIVVLQNGSELEGYISKQSSSDGIDFVAYKSTISLPKEVVSDNKTRKTDKKDLNPEWKKWFATNNPTTKNAKSITLHDLQLALDIDTLKYSNYISLINQIRNPRNVFVLQRTSSEWLILDLKEKHFHFNWKDIKEIKGVESNPNSLTGILTNIRLKKSNQVLQGTISNQIPGSSLTILLTDGIYKDININDIATIEKEAKNPYYDIFSQSPVIETVVTNSGRDYKGIISSQNYERDDYPYLTVLDYDGKLSLVPQSERKVILRTPNPQYKEIVDVELNDDTLLLNYSNFIKFDTIDENASLIFYAPKNVTFHKLNSKEYKDREVVIWANSSFNLDSVTIIKITELDITNKSIKTVWENVKKEVKTEKIWDIDSLQWFVNDLYSVTPSSFDVMGQTPLGNKGLKCKVYSSGKYLIYQRGKKRGILLDII